MAAIVDGTERTVDTSDRVAATVLVLRGILPDDRTRCVLKGNRFVIGRGAEADVRLEFERVSRLHAELERQGPIFALRDAGSTNGTFVDGRKVQHCVVRGGMLLRIGHWLGTFQQVREADRISGFSELAPGLYGGELLERALLPIRAAARSDLPVVLVGATGSGKERFAAAVHHLSGRSGPLHAINCAAVPRLLAEGELFGYRRGAFTGADRNYDGHFRAAAAGTLFLDELAELSLELQAKLLRVLEQRQVAPLGETRSFAFQARVVVALQRPLDRLVQEGKLREDLAARLKGIVIEIPSLRERHADVPSLFLRFLSEHSGGRPPSVATKLYESLCLHDWPGNVRELELLARRMLSVHSLEPLLRREFLPEELRRSLAEAQLPPVAVSNRRDHDLIQFLSALERTNGNVKLAAQIVGISRQRAYRLLNGNKLSAGGNESS